MNATFSHMRIAGISSVIPAHTVSNINSGEHFSQQELEKIVASTGVTERHIAVDMCTSDLCHAAAEQLLETLNWARDSIDVLIFISQTPDYLLPATSCTLQARLGLSKKCAAFDVNLGCSGYIYGLWLAANLLNSSSNKRILLLVGDTISRIASPLDRSVFPLFGDAGTATALERNESVTDNCFFSLGTDGTGQNHLIVPAGGFRTRIATENPTQNQDVLQAEANIRSESDLYMNGGEIFAFTLREIPPLVTSILTAAQWSMADVDAFVFHQANRFMLQHLMKRLKIPEEKFIISLEKFGNTSSASIPLSITAEIASNSANYQRLLLVGFGVGFSWGAAAVTIDKHICLPPLIMI